MLRWLLLLVCTSLPLQSSYAADLLLYTEEWPPLNFTENGQVTGYSVELVQALAKITGDQVQIKSVPWTRGYALAQQEANVGLFSVGRVAAREPLFQWVGPLISAHDRFYTLKGSSLKVNNLDDARPLRLVLPRLWYSLQYLESQGFEQIYTVTSPQIMMTMFRNGRSDVLAASDVTLANVLAQGDLTPDDVVAQYSFMEHGSYLVFSPATDPALVARWQAALESFKAAGGLTPLYRRWVSHMQPPASSEAAVQSAQPR